MERKSDLTEVKYFKDSLLAAAGDYYAQEMALGRKMENATPFVRKFRCTAAQARMLLEAAKFKYDLQQKGII